MFDWKKPTVQMLGRWQPWHDGHQALFKRCIEKTGQVMIQVKASGTAGQANVPDGGTVEFTGASGGQDQEDNPFNWETVCKNIQDGLLDEGFERGVHYEIMLVPNIVHITYGRAVGYTFEEETFDDTIKSISATKIRRKMRDEGDLS